MVKIKFFIYDMKYETVDDKPLVKLFGRSTKGERIIVLDNNFKPYFLVKSDIETIKRFELKDNNAKIIKVDKVTRKIEGENIELIRVHTNYPKAVPIIAKEFEEKGITNIFETDIPFIRRYTIDKKITPMTSVEVEGEQIGQGRAKVFRSDKVTSLEDEEIKDLKTLGIDIETYNPEGKKMDAEKNPIIMMSFYGKDYAKVITWKKFKTKEKYIEFVDSELELIERFKEILTEYKPEAITGYFSDEFDIPYIGVRAKKYKIILDIGLDGSEIKINNREVTKARIPGIVHIDIYKFIRRVIGRTLKTQRYNLDSVAEEILGNKKVEVDINKLKDAWDNNEGLELYCKYNLIDSKLTYELTEKLMPNILELVKITKVLPFNVNRLGFSQLIEAYLLDQTKHYKEIIKRKPLHGEVKERIQYKYEGAFVYEPKAGIYEDIILLDFKSLYPTIISSHNISTETLNCDCCKGEDKTPNIDEDYWFCKKRRGFIADVINNLITRRMRVKGLMSKKKKDPVLSARSEALKVLANSLYGYYGFFGARWYSKGCARSITALGRSYIHKVIDRSEKEGFKVIYSDTDSVFLLLGKKKMEEINKFTEKINIELPGLMELEYEDHYLRGIFVQTKEGSGGAKKKYAMLSKDGEIKITGFETVRKNWSPIAKEVQRNALEMILKEKDGVKVIKYIKGIIKQLKEHKITIDKLIIRTQLTKNIGEYVQIGPHVAVAKRMIEKGMTVGSGSTIEYVIIHGKDMIRDRARIVEEVKQKDYDSDYYIKNQVVPGMESIISVLGYKKDELLSDDSQKGLDNFI